jgi:hypothetical protein
MVLTLQAARELAKAAEGERVGAVQAINDECKLAKTALIINHLSHETSTIVDTFAAADGKE